MQALYLKNNGVRTLPPTLFKGCQQLSILDLHGTEITNDVLRQVLAILAFFFILVWFAFHFLIWFKETYLIFFLHFDDYWFKWTQGLCAWISLAAFELNNSPNQHQVLDFYIKYGHMVMNLWWLIGFKKHIPLEPSVLL